MQAALAVANTETNVEIVGVFDRVRFETVASYFEREYPEAFGLINDPSKDLEPDIKWCLEQTAKAGMLARPLINPQTKTLDYAFPNEVLEACFMRY
ncbi:hypothetical protein [Brucella sp. 10RB9210]|uniref:hypothetical protein n=1 Tax=Brucella sp. 10RB9210 TaxID=1844037 RepID=UPI0012AE28F3|nr:hypothetical protein [Brucella sp. 10RB9210]MRN79436.1 hypothetical protein [Brucella sp. 10RB9210]